MKKAKIMLLTIAVLATVGTALAFKVKNYGNTDYCYAVTTSTPAAIDCDRVVLDKSIPGFTNGATKVYYTATTDLNNCTTLSCTNVGKTPFNN